MNSTQESDRKAIIRRRIRDGRAVQAPFERIEVGHAISHGVLEVLNAVPPTCVAAYFSTDTEPSTDELLESLWARGIRVLTPRVQGDELQWIETSRDSATEIGSFGIREVQGEQIATLKDAQAIVIPALAIDPMGFRLGQGGGFYDRALAEFVDPPLLIAVVHDREDLLDIPVESHDARMDVIVTERHTRYITPMQK